ncbi:MAG: arylsulfatase, partial [Planctomycetaceae bacterium]
MTRRAIAGMLAGCIAGIAVAHAAAQERGAAVGPAVVVHPPLRFVASDAADGISVEGDVARGVLGDTRTEISGNGVRLLSGARRGAAGNVSFTVGGLKATQGRWYRFRIRGLVEEDFHVERDDLYLRVDFFKDGGKDPLDHVKKSIYAQVDRERADFTDPGTNKNLGPATWRNYVLEFRTPFPEVDTLRLSVGFGFGAAKGKWNEFWISEMEIESIPEPAGSVPNAKVKAAKPPTLSELVRLGGRWYYDPQNGPQTPPRRFDQTNADRLFYQGGRLEAPLAYNMTAWVRKGYLERGSTKQNPTLVEQDRFVEDSVVVSFTDQHLVIRSKNLPNHPTAVFPDRWRLLDGNPNYIQEQDFSFFIPLEPRENPRHVAMDPENRNQALPGGPIGVMANGVIFHNPFDERINED